MLSWTKKAYTDFPISAISPAELLRIASGGAVVALPGGLTVPPISCAMILDKTAHWKQIFPASLLNKNPLENESTVCHWWFTPSGTRGNSKRPFQALVISKLPRVWFVGGSVNSARNFPKPPWGLEEPIFLFGNCLIECKNKNKKKFKFLNGY